MTAAWLEPRRCRRVAFAVLSALVVGTFLPASRPAAAATAQPAFYTDEAPGGAATAGQRVIALTFDDGPGPSTAAVLGILQQYRVPATFFDVGIEVAQDPQLAHQEVADGFSVQNHTWNHPNLTTI